MLLQAQGGPVDEHWEYWARHLASPTAAAELARLRVGRLADPVAPADPYAEGQPERALQLHHVIQERPLCTETLCNVLDADAVTPNEAFYIRNHAPVPRLPLDGAHRLALGPTRTVSVQELQGWLILLPTPRFDSTHTLALQTPSLCTRSCPCCSARAIGAATTRRTRRRPTRFTGTWGRV